MLCLVCLVSMVIARMGWTPENFFCWTDGTSLRCERPAQAYKFEVLAHPSHILLRPVASLFVDYSIITLLNSQLIRKPERLSSAGKPRTRFLMLIYLLVRVFDDIGAGYFRSDACERWCEGRGDEHW